jgi:hypothetical protein
MDKWYIDVPDHNPGWYNPIVFAYGHHSYSGGSQAKKVKTSKGVNFYQTAHWWWGIGLPMGDMGDPAAPGFPKPGNTSNDGVHLLDPWREATKNFTDYKSFTQTQLTMVNLPALSGTKWSNDELLGDITCNPDWDTCKHTDYNVSDYIVRETMKSCKPDGRFCVDRMFRASATVRDTTKKNTYLIAAKVSTEEAIPSPTPNPTPSPPPPPVPCQGDPHSWDAGYGGCSTYAAGHDNSNHMYCHEDFDSHSNLLAQQVCAECGVCTVR